MIELNPAYEHLRADVQSIDSLIARATLIHRGRNTLYQVDMAGLHLCIKCYGFSSVFKRWMYRYLRASKARRAWRNTLLLRQAGIHSPEPVALLETYSLRGIETSYYICRYEPGATLYHLGDLPLSECRPTVVRLARFAAAMHERDIMLSDFTPGNILLTAGGFALVDTNRMSIGRVSLLKGLHNMAGLWLQPDAAELLAREYVTARGETSPEPYVRAFACYRRLFWKRFARRHRLRGLIIHRDMDGSSYTYHFNTTIR
ncbi:MAG: hypothetical protein IJ609_05035 [Paludibacteraceae bacterium]|nr:hypothetical protein [Paludibacteraceae bacterium]